MTNREKLKESNTYLDRFSEDFIPNAEDIMIAYSVLKYYENEYGGETFSNLSCCFSTVSRLLARKYSKNK